MFPNSFGKKIISMSLSNRYDVVLYSGAACDLVVASACSSTCKHWVSLAHSSSPVLIHEKA